MPSVSLSKTNEQAGRNEAQCPDDVAAIKHSTIAVTLPMTEMGPSMRPSKGDGSNLSPQNVVQVPLNNMWIVVPSMMLVLFLSALDNTIVTTALPTISSELDATPSQYSWVGTAYNLLNTVMVPCWGRLSDIAGRKAIMTPGVVVFFVGSALCGSAKSMPWLIGARALQGLGGSAIISLTQIIIGDIVPLHKRGAFNSWLGLVWGMAAVLGPLLGGLICQHTTWRWIFFINLPLCAIGLPALQFNLKLPPRKQTTWKDMVETFDFLGLALVMTACAFLVVGFAFASDDGWLQKTTLAFLITGAVLFVASLVNFLMTRRNAIIPARLLKTPTTVIWLVSSTLHAMVFLSASFYLPIFFQWIENASPLMSGIYVIPFSLSFSVGAVIAGQINTRLRIFRPVVWSGYAMATLGLGLCIKYLVFGGGIAAQMVLLVIAGLGIGLSITVPLLCIQAAMPVEEMAASTTAWLLTRALGCVLGIASFQAVISNGLESRFSQSEWAGLLEWSIASLDSESYARVHALPRGPQKDQALSAFSDSIRQLWIIWTPMMGVALLLSLGTRSYSMQSPHQDEASVEENDLAEAKQQMGDLDVEKGVGQDLSPAQGQVATVNQVPYGKNAPLQDPTTSSAPISRGQGPDTMRHKIM